MRLVIAVCTLLFLAMALSGATAAAPPVGLSVEVLQGRDVIVCPYCHKVIVAGEIREDARDVLLTEIGGYLDEKGIDHTGEKNAPLAFNVFIYRFRERMGGDFAAEKPASVGFHVHLLEGGAVRNVFVFDQTQQPLSENVLTLPTFLRRGAKWITAGELAREGVHKAVDLFEADLAKSK